MTTPTSTPPVGAPTTPAPPPPPATEGEAAVADGRATQSIARTIAREMVQGMKAATPPVEAPPAVPAAAPAVDGTAQPPVEEFQPEPVNLAELHQLLVESGLDLGVSPEEVPEEFRPGYERLVRGAAQLLEDALTERLNAQDAMASVDQLKTKLEQAPDKVLLAYAVSQPELFEKVTQVFSEMQQDPRVRDLVRRELEAEARLQEAQRLAASATQRDIQGRTRQVLNATKAASRKYGVPYEAAEKVVALVIRAEQGNVGPEHVDKIVADMVPRPAQRAKPFVTPQKVAAAAAAPGAPVPPAAPPAAGTPAANRGTMTGFRGLVRDAVAKLTNPQQ